MTDPILPARLRSAADLFGGYRADVMREAADRIERLEREVAQRSAEIKVRDEHRILEEFTTIRDTIALWVADPAPKLTGLSILVMPFRIYPDQMGVELRFGCERGEIRFASCHRFHPVELTPNRDLEGWIGSRLNALHEMLVREIRDHAAKAKACRI